MNSDVKDEAYYRKLWTGMFPSRLKVAFENGVLVNAYCSRCRFCCGPQAEERPFPMALLDRQISARTPDDFYLLDSRTASLDRRGCKSLGPGGCRLERPLRPLACGLFPLVLVNRRLYLYKICPASMLEPLETFQAMAAQVKAMLDALPAADVERISITRDPEDLKAKYLDLGLDAAGS